MRTFHPVTVRSFSAGASASAGASRPHATPGARAQRTRMSLPFAGEWVVCNGGRDAAGNLHPGAFDFVRPHRGDGAALDDYGAYGAPVLAPAAGVVCEVIDGHPDAPPGRDGASGTPNLVAIDHGNGEWSVLAHFQPGSIRAAVGQRLARGEVLGRCGNSGDSSEPHIHLHVQSSRDLGRMTRDLVPLAFADIVVDGRRVRRAEPTRGQRVEAPAQKDRAAAET